MNVTDQNVNDYYFPNTDKGFAGGFNGLVNFINVPFSYVSSEFKA